MLLGLFLFFISTIISRPPDREGVIRDQLHNISTLRAIVNHKNASLRALHKRKQLEKRRLEYALSGSQWRIDSARRDAVAQLTCKDKEMDNLRRECHQLLDPGQTYPSDMSVSIVATFGTVRRQRVEKELQEREAALKDEGIYDELQKAKEAIRDQRLAFDRQSQEKEWLNFQLSEIIFDQQGWLSYTRRSLNEEKLLRTELEKVLIIENRKLADVESELSTLETRLIESNKLREVQAKELEATHEAHRKASGRELEHVYESHKIQLECMEEEKKQLHFEKEMARFGEENFRAQLEDFRSQKVRVQKELDKLHALFLESQSQIKHLINDSTEEHLRAAAIKEESLKDRVHTMESQNERLRSQTANLNSRNADLEEQLSNAINTSKTAQQEVVDALQTSTTVQQEVTNALQKAEKAEKYAQVHRDEVIDFGKLLQASRPETITLVDCVREVQRRFNEVQADTEAKLGRRQEGKDATKQELDRMRVDRDRLQIDLNTTREDLTSERTEVMRRQDIIDSGKTRRKKMEEKLAAAEASAKILDDDVKKTTADVKKISVERDGLQAKLSAAEKMANQHLCELESETKEREMLDDTVETQQRLIREIEIKRKDLEVTLTFREAELVSKRAEMYMAHYGVGPRLGREETDENDEGLEKEKGVCPEDLALLTANLRRAMALSEEDSATPYDAKCKTVLQQLSRCNDDIETLRSMVQSPKVHDAYAKDPTVRPKLEALRDVLRNSDIDSGTIKHLEQDAPLLQKQAWKGNMRVFQLNKMLNRAAAKAVAERAAAKGTNGKADVQTAEGSDEEADEVLEQEMAQQTADAALCRELYYKLLEPRGDEDESGDENMAGLDAAD